MQPVYVNRTDYSLPSSLTVLPNVIEKNVKTVKALAKLNEISVAVDPLLQRLGQPSLSIQDVLDVEDKLAELVSDTTAVTRKTPTVDVKKDNLFGKLRHLSARVDEMKKVMDMTGVPLRYTTGELNRLRCMIVSLTLGS